MSSSLQPSLSWSVEESDVQPTAPVWQSSGARSRTPSLSSSGSSVSASLQPSSSWSVFAWTDSQPRTPVGQRSGLKSSTSSLSSSRSSLES